MEAAPGEEGPDAIELEIVGGKVTLVVPHDAPADVIMDPEQFGSRAHWEIELEGGLHVSLWLPEGSAYAQVYMKPSQEAKSGGDT